MPDLYIPYWMRGTPLEQVYIDAWVTSGDVTLAREAVRESAAYESLFAGNKRDDGSIRYDEDTYLSILDSFENTLLSVNLNPDVFAHLFPGLIEGEVSPNEFVYRVENVYERVLDAIPEVRQTMNEYYETGFTDTAILASFLDPDVGTAILDKRLALAEIGASASTRGFDVAKDFANMLYEAGTDTESEAAQLFSLAENALPTLNVLAARHANPDDDFSLEEFAAAEVFSDPDQRRRMRMMLSQERASFRSGTGIALARASSGTRAGGLTGLTQP